MRASEIARSLGEKPNGNGFSCRCPVPGHGQGHGDRTPSLSIADGDKELLVKCHADSKDVLEELKRRGLYKPQPSGTRTIKKTLHFDYRDPMTGKVCYRKKRIEYSDGTNSCSFDPLRIGPPLLYGGERVADISEGKPVFIVEGEPKVDRLRELGFVAVSADSGAESKWLPSHAELLRGLPVILWPDSDEPGEKYVANADAVLRETAASISVVRPFGKPNGSKGRDVCDWEGDIAALAASAEPYEAKRGNGQDTKAEEHDGEAWPNSENSKPGRIVAKPYAYRDPKTIPPRQWLHAGHYIRGCLQLVEAVGFFRRQSHQAALARPEWQRAAIYSREQHRRAG